MEVLIAGADGIVGEAVVLEAVENKDISRIFVLTRRPLSAHTISFAKVNILDYVEFSTYLLSRNAYGLANIGACIWSFETDQDKDKFDADPREIFLVYPILTLRVLLSALVPQMVEGKTFRFVFVSRKFAKRDQDEPWEFMRESKHFHTDAEKLLKDAKGRHEGLNLMIVRPIGVMKHSRGFLTNILGRLTGYIEVDRLARCLVKLAVCGSGEKVLSLKDVRMMGNKKEER
ncbi:hypothetical protein GGR51DRAFT_574749 [Nemania sp. FL0031]|nr:hypothetical protein GGR51DRAFT_574749 [Nemania sp. FL0031]